MIGVLFNRSEYHALNGTEHRTVEVDGVGSVSGALLPSEQFDSGWSAPYGGFDLLPRHDNVAGACALVEQLTKCGFGLTRVRCRPGFYGPHEAFALLNAGFTVERCGLNHHIDLAAIEKPEAYVAGLKREAQRALRQAESEPFIFSATDWYASYNVLAENRKAKGRRLALDYDYVRKIVATFPGQIHMLSLWHATQVCAAALVYEVLARRFYVVAWGDAFHDLPRSPMNRLAYEVVAWAIERDALSLDLGLSSLDGRADSGLAQFKQSVGAQPSLRLDLVWQP